MQVKFDTDELEPCQCGFIPDHYTVGYGRTPYDIYCPNCRKQTTFAKCKITGSKEHLFDYWNTVIRHMTLDEMHHEASEFIKIQKEKTTGYDGYNSYDYYWVKGKGEILSKS